MILIQNNYLSSQICTCISVYPAAPPSAVVSWTDCHRLSHCSPHMMSGLQPPPHSHQPLQSAEGCVLHSPASSAGTQWEQLPTKYTNIDNTVIVIFVCLWKDYECGLTRIQRTVRVALGCLLWAAQCRGILPSLSGIPMFESCLISSLTCSGWL